MPHSHKSPVIKAKIAKYQKIPNRQTVWAYMQSSNNLRR